MSQLLVQVPKRPKLQNTTRILVYLLNARKSIV